MYYKIEFIIDYYVLFKYIIYSKKLIRFKRRLKRKNVIRVNKIFIYLLNILFTKLYDDVSYFYKESLIIDPNNELKNYKKYIFYNNIYKFDINYKYYFSYILNINIFNIVS